MSRRLIILASTLGTIAAILLPISLAGWIAYRNAFAGAEDMVALRADALAENSRFVLSQIVRGLSQTDTLPLDCTPAVVQRLRELAFDIPEVTETGLMTPDGRLICSSWGPVDPPEQFDIEPIEGELAIKGPVEARVIGRLVLVAERKRPDGGYSNALVRPRPLVGLSGSDMDGTALLALFDRSQNRPLISIGLVPGLTQDAGGRISFADGIERIVGTREVEGFPQLLAVAAVTRTSVIDTLWSSTAMPVALGLLTAMILAGSIIVLTRRRLSLPAELKRAIDGRRLRVHYQPVVDIQRGRCVGVEALLRWHHDTRGNIRPDLFVPLAEQEGLIDDVTRVMLERVMADMSPILRDDPDMHVAVNIVPEHLGSDWFGPLLDRVVMSSPVAPAQVILEFSERTFTAADGPETRRALQGLTHRGCGLAMDDFGAGYSSMAHLRNIALSYIKIDRHFIAAIGADASSSNLVDAIVDIADRLGVRVIAEGVETQEQLAYLKGRGVEFMQGFYYARPLTLKQLHQFMEEFERSWQLSSIG